ncbi:hypothetical protein ACFYNO_24010 [Kitasatospora sp. NPDC006697]|uniref:hypothetical protein n=1 Tax=Kitasatospora sp. NPDC006697 TaxID=3364020 RepID=UPI0036C68C43
MALWEDAINYFAEPTQNASPTRSDITGLEWVRAHGVNTVTDATGLDKVWDIYWVTYNSYYSDYVVVNMNLMWDNISPKTGDGKVDKFFGHARDTLNALLGSPGYTSTTALASFNAAHDMLAALPGWVSSLVKQLKGWADTIDSEDSDLQGSAAGELKSYLESVGKSMQDMVTLIEFAGDPAASVQAAHDALYAGLSRMNTEFLDWQGGSPQNEVDQEWNDQYPNISNPLNCLKYALNGLMASGTVTYPDSSNYTILQVNGLRTDQQAFWDTVEANAKALWIQGVQQFLDRGATIAMTAITEAYTTLNNVITTITLTPETPSPAAITPPTGNPGGNGSNGNNGGNGNGTNGPNGINGPNGNNSKNGPNNTKIPPPPTTANPDPKYDNNNPANPGGTVPLLGPDGKPLTTKDGKPWTVPAGSTIDANGTVIGPDGKPVLGPDGKPEKAPAGAKVGSLPPSPGPGGLYNPTGGNFRVPPGSTVDANGMVLGPDGKPVLDANGNPVYAGKNAKVGKDGTLLDQNGNPVGNQEQLLTNEEHAMGDSLIPLRTGGSGYTPLEDFAAPGTTVPALSSGATALEPGLPLERFPAPTSVPTEGGLPAGPGAVGLGPRALAQGASLTPREAAAQEAVMEQAAAERTAAGESAAMNAAEEAQLMGRSVSTTGGAGMPPMMPGAGGGGAPGQGQERQRTTWLAEDEEVWGTETEVVDGVIGR